METVWLLIQELFILYSIGLIGFMAKRMNVLSEASDHVLTQLILSITLPALILFSMQFPYSSKHLISFGQLILLSAYILIMACVVGRFMYLKSRILKSRAGVYQSLIIFGNQGFIGYAVCYILFKETGIVFAACFNLLYLLLIWTYCPYLIGKEKITFTWKTMLLSPGILATVGGLFLWFLPLQWPRPILHVLELVGKMTIPLSMLMIGGLLANLKSKELCHLLRNRHIWYASIAKLMIIPLLLLPAFLMPISFKILTVAILITASPSAPTTSLFAYKYGKDVYFASVGVFLSTLLAMITLPLIYTFLLWMR